MPWISPYVMVLGIALAGVSVFVGLLRRDSRYVILLNTVGVVLFSFGLAWSNSLGQQAFGAVAAASLGAILWTMGSERSRAKS